jgi:hypothetical protein
MISRPAVVHGSGATSCASVGAGMAQSALASQSMQRTLGVLTPGFVMHWSRSFGVNSAKRVDCMHDRSFARGIPFPCKRTG